MKRVEIFFRSLDKETQQELLAATGARTGDDNNWGVIPIAILDYEVEEDDGEWIVKDVSVAYGGEE